VNTLRPLAGKILRLLPLNDEEGQTLVEYALLLALIALVVFVAVFVLGDIVADFFFDFGNTVDDITT
jgi:Flp pilus assembly pilin Flp